MRRLISIAAIFLLIGVAYCFLAYAAYQVSYTDMRTENFAVFKQRNLKLAINFTLYNSEGQAIGKSATFDLNKQEQRAVLNFIKPYIGQIALEYDVSPDSWAAPGDKLFASPTALDFGAEETDLDFNISNTGAVAIDWSVVPDHASITCYPSSGSLDGGDKVEVQATWDRTGLPSGSYVRAIDWTSDSGSGQITVTGIVP
jgi:hypothetical protein